MPRTHVNASTPDVISTNENRGVRGLCACVRSAIPVKGIRCQVGASL